ncbi:MAG TPA: hypothetical protein DDZ81_10595 [Acetobacteraceae bacterium]|jgi:hypothetical protein|nr:hypothetical protein [Acetobacteraceae bacterium]
MNSRVLILVCIGLAGCSDMTSTQQRALSGTTIGAAGGAVLGAIGGNAALGAAAGAGAGLVGGLIYDSTKKNQEAAYQQGYSAGTQSKP